MLNFKQRQCHRHDIHCTDSSISSSSFTVRATRCYTWLMTVPKASVVFGPSEDLCTGNNDATVSTDDNCTVSVPREGTRRQSLFVQGAFELANLRKEWGTEQAFMYRMKSTNDVFRNSNRTTIRTLNEQDALFYENLEEEPYQHNEIIIESLKLGQTALMLQVIFIVPMISALLALSELIQRLITPNNIGAWHVYPQQIATQAWGENTTTTLCVEWSAKLLGTELIVPIWGAGATICVLVYFLMRDSLQSQRALARLKFAECFMVFCCVITNWALYFNLPISPGKRNKFITLTLFIALSCIGLVDICRSVLPKCMRKSTTNRKRVTLILKALHMLTLPVMVIAFLVIMGGYLWVTIGIENAAIEIFLTAVIFPGAQFGTRKLMIRVVSAMAAKSVVTQKKNKNSEEFTAGVDKPRQQGLLSSVYFMSEVLLCTPQMTVLFFVNEFSTFALALILSFFFETCAKYTSLKLILETRLAKIISVEDATHPKSADDNALTVAQTPTHQERKMDLKKWLAVKFTFEELAEKNAVLTASCLYLYYSVLFSGSITGINLLKVLSAIVMEIVADISKHILAARFGVFSGRVKIVFSSSLVGVITFTSVSCALGIAVTIFLPCYAKAENVAWQLTQGFT